MSHNKGRQRAGSTPALPPPAYPDAQNSSANALNAATVSHSASVKAPTGDGWNSAANQAARVTNLGANMDREMFGAQPPVEIEREEAKHQAALRASAVSMAKQIYSAQDRTAMTADPAELSGAQAAAVRSSTSTVQPDIKQEAMRYIHLQEAAHRLAAERLAKVDKATEDKRYREYYGYEDKPKKLSSRLSMRSGVSGGRQRKRASSEGNADLDDSDDEEQAQRIRSQMSQLNTGLNKVDEKKQQDDRAKLLAAAEKRVSARMHNMDEKVFADTGKVPPALMEEWETKARERAQRDREQQAQNPGKTHIGGGKFMEQSEIEAIAAARLKPTLDEISETAANRRARDEELRLEREEQERQKRDEKAKNKEEKEEQKRVKNEEKAATRKEKEEEKSRKNEEKRLAKEEKRKSRDIKENTAAASAAGVALAEVAEKVKDDEEPDDGEAADGVQKHKSALSRLKEKFRKSQVAGESPAEHGDKRSSEATTTATPITSAVAEPEGLDAQQASHAAAENEKTAISEPAPVVESPERDSRPVTHTESVEDNADDEADDHDKWKPVAATTAVAVPAIVVDGNQEDNVTAKPERPTFEQKPSLSGYHNDEVVFTENESTKPDLERHISQIPESDADSDSDDWSQDDERPRTPLGKEDSQAVAARVLSATVVDTTTAAPTPENDRTDATLPQLAEQRADPARTSATSSAASGVPKAAPITEPVTTDPNIQLETDAKQKDHSILRQVVNPHGKKYDEQAYGTTAHAATVADNEASTSKETTETAKLKQKPDTSAVTAEEPEKERKGFRGFFNKLRHKDSKPDSKTSDAKSASQPSKTVPYESTEKPGAAAASASADTEHVSGATTGPTSNPSEVDVDPSFSSHTGTDGPIGDSQHVSGLDGNPRATSPSSFKRGEGVLNDPDDVSSSDADEDDVTRGRRGGGGVTRKLGPGSRGDKDEAKRADSNAKVSDEQFEEARDHFDENLAPPPAYGGQTKSGSPVRETRFQEEL